MNASAKIDERFLELQQGNFRIKVLSAGTGQPVLFLHVAGGLFWDPFLEGLAQHFAVYAPEHPGSLESTGLEHLDNLWDLVLYYNDLLDALDLQTVPIVGHSFGGMVAAELAANNPDRVSKLVLIAPVGLWRDDQPIADIAGTPPNKLIELLLYDPQGPLAQAIMPAPDNPDALFRATLTQASVLHFIWPIPDKGLSKRIHRVKAPTLLICGKQDGLVPPVYADEFAARITNAQVELIDRAAHIPQLEQGEQVSKLVRDFLR